MTRISVLSETGTLIGQPARTAMLVALMDGRALTAGELALAGGVSAATASAHLARLSKAGLIAASTGGRHRYFRLADPRVATMIESMMGVAGLVDATRSEKPIVTGPRDNAMRHARICYDHLAGGVAVAIADGLASAGYIELTLEGAAVTERGATFLQRLGLAFGDEAGKPTGTSRTRMFCRPCMDWSERRPHLAGLVGRSLLQLFIDRSWLRRVEGSRLITVTPAGTRALQRHFGVG